MADAPPNSQAVPPPLPRWKKYLKLCLKLFLWFIAVLIVLLILLICCRDLLVAAAIRNIVPKITGSQVLLRDFSTTLNGSLYIRDLQLCNPPGYSQPHLLKHESLYIKLDVSTLFSEMPVIEVIESKGLTLNYEVNEDGISNIAVMQEKMDSFFGTPPTKPETVDKASEEPEKGAVSPLIRRLTCEDARLQSGQFSIPLPSITLENLGGKNSIRVALRENLNTLLTSVNKTGDSLNTGVSLINNTGKKLVQFGNDAGKNIKDTFNKVFKNNNQKEKKQK